MSLTPFFSCSAYGWMFICALFVRKHNTQRSGTESAGDNGGSLCDCDAVKPAQSVRLCFDLPDELCWASHVGDEQLPFVYLSAVPELAANISQDRFLIAAYPERFEDELAVSCAENRMDPEKTAQVFCPRSRISHAI